MRINQLYTIIGLLCVILSIQACKEKSGNKQTVSVSILPQKYLVEKIAGDYLQVNVMIPPGMSPETCDLSTEQLKKLYDSDICFTIGHLPFELTHLAPVVKQRKDIRIINHSEGIKLLSGSCGHQHHNGHEHSGVDPHIWSSPRYVAQMAQQIFKALSEQYPTQKEKFEEGYKTLSKEIETVKEKADSALNEKRGSMFLIYHPALTYLADDYGLQQVAIENEGKEPNPAHLKHIIDLAKEKNIRIIFIQSQFDKNNALSVAKEIGGEVIPIDPLAENWTEEINKLIKVLQEKL